MSVEFSNAYQEILLDNLVAIIKQNFIFQTQIKLSENSSKEKEELQIKLNDLIEKYNSAKAKSIIGSSGRRVFASCNFASLTSGIPKI